MTYPSRTLLECLNSNLNCIELAMAVASTNWHYAQAIAAMEGILECLKIEKHPDESDKVKAPADITAEVNRLRARLNDLLQLVHRRQELKGLNHQ